MSESDNKTGDNKTGGKTLSLRKGGTEQSRVKQSFSHGRSKSVVVEKKRSKRVVTPKEPGAAETTAKPAQPRPTAKDAGGRRGKGGGGKGGGRGTMLQSLSDEEYARRVKALEAAKKAAEAQKQAAAAEEKRRAAEAAEAKAKAEAEAREAAEKAQQEEQAEADARQKAEADAKAAEEERKRLEAEEAAAKAKAEADAAAAKEAEKATQQDPQPVAVKPAPEKPAKAPAEPVQSLQNEEVTAKLEGPRTGAAVDISALAPKLPGPKIIKRADPIEVAKRQQARKTEEKEKAAERNRPARGGAAAAGAAEPGGGAPAGPSSRPGGGARPGAPRQDEQDRKPRTSRGGEKRRSGKLTINQALTGEEGGRQRSLASIRRRQEREKRKAANSGQAAKVVRDVKIPDAITVQELANRMAERGADVIKTLMKMGMMVTINQAIDADTAQLVVEEFGHRFARVSDAAVEDGLVGDDDNDADLKARAPIVTIMGHVDHGKTSLLDALRNANVVAGEAGGITQHIGAYQVKTDSGIVTFLDTPGHAAFTAMRARGANVTDIVILVVAADDSVMPQTIEAISHAKAAEVPMIIAINKIDKPAADANKVRTELLQHDVQVEAMGGEVLDVEVSAVTGQGLDQLLENIILQSELLDLKANPDRNAEGVVVEAQLDVGRGAVATVLVNRGTLKVGDVFVVGEQWGKVRALINDHGDRVQEAGPSVPVEVLGLNGTPEAGDTLVAVEDEARAREIADYRQRLAREKQSVVGARASLDQLLAQAKADENVSELPVIVKSDVQGSNEAIIQALEKIGNDEVRVRVLHNGVGAITESDVTLAEASNAPIIGFNVRANAPARESANQKGVEIRYYSIIYDLVDDVKAAASGLLSPEIKETFLGNAEILEVFRISGVGNVAGCRISEGVARRHAGVRLLRDNVVIHEGKLKTLKRFKDEVKEVQGGQECGMAFEKYEDIRAGDVIEIFTTEEIERSL